MKQLIRLCDKAVLRQTRKTSFILQIESIKKANLNIKANVIKNLATHFRFLLKYFFEAKDVLNVIKKVVSLKITHNKSVIT